MQVRYRSVYIYFFAVLRKTSAWNDNLPRNLENMMHVHATPEEFENRDLFLRLGLTSTLIFENVLQIGGIWKR